MPIRSLLPLLLAATLLAPAVAHAGPSPLLHDRIFTVTLEAESHSVYDVPRLYRPGSCYDRPWYEAHAEETIAFRSRRPTRVGALLAGNRTASFARLHGEDAAGAVPAGGSIVRSLRQANGADPGDCGANTTPTEIYTGRDCGTRMVGYEVALELVAGRLWLHPFDEPKAPIDQGTYRECTLPYIEGQGSWNVVTAPLSVKKLRTAAGPFSVTASKVWKEPVHGTQGSATTTIRWKVTFTPATPKAPRRAKRRR